jgi:hypothetical protein
MDMKFDDTFSFAPDFPHAKDPSLFTPGNILTIYTTLCILSEMKKRLGLEAMLEYIEKYCRIVEGNNPELKSAVEKALMHVDAEKIYKDTMKCKI